MTMNRRDGYTLENLEAAAWLTGVIPSRAQRESLRAGDLAKLRFELPDGRGEWMWVEVRYQTETKFVAMLRNEPEMVPLEFDDFVEFGPENVYAIERAKVVLQ
jgi:uncharacterized protein YegJ (DUF2314 family)